MKAPTGKKFFSKFTKRKNDDLASFHSTTPSQNDDPVGSHGASPSNNSDLSSPQSAAPFNNDDPADSQSVASSNNNDEPSALNTFTCTVTMIMSVTEAIGLPYLRTAIGDLSKVLESIEVCSLCMYLYSYIMCELWNRQPRIIRRYSNNSEIA